MGGGSLTPGSTLPSPNLSSPPLSRNHLFKVQLSNFRSFAAPNRLSSAITVSSSHSVTLSNPTRSKSTDRTTLPKTTISSTNHSEHNASNPIADVDLELDDDDSVSISLMTPTSSSSEPQKAAHSAMNHVDADIQQDGHSLFIHTSNIPTSKHCSSPPLPLRLESTYSSLDINRSKQRPASFQLRRWLQATDKEEITTIERIQQHHSLSCPFVSDLSSRNKC